MKMDDHSKKTRKELLGACKSAGLKGYSTKNKADLIALLTDPSRSTIVVVAGAGAKAKANAKAPSDKIARLNYIGSKFQLIDWLTTNILQKTGWESFAGKVIADVFAGTGVVSHHFRRCNTTVISNDAELYSSIITRAFTRSVFTLHCKELLATLQGELDTSEGRKIGFVTKHYSPYDGNERKFFTVDNAQRIDYLRQRVEELRSDITEDEYTFLLASIIISADAVSNVPAVYGCFLKEFKAKATKSLVLQPIHTIEVEPVDGSRTYNSDVLNEDFLKSFEADCVYLDPPYNERQYSKNYFPLNIIAKTPHALESEGALKGKTGIPVDCFISPFCKKGATVEGALDTLFRGLNAHWIFMSYNSESIVSRDKVLEIIGRYGVATVVERDYKRFKSFEYNKDVEIKEYLFCLEKHVGKSGAG
jgi:adenine-specific DNA-methyltransferase